MGRSLQVAVRCCRRPGNSAGGSDGKKEDSLSSADQVLPTPAGGLPEPGRYHHFLGPYEAEPRFSKESKEVGLLLVRPR